MRKYLNPLLLGSVISASAVAFAREPVLVLSDAQMDGLTAGTGETDSNYQSNIGNNVVLGLNPAVAILSNGNVISGDNFGQSNSAPDQSNIGTTFVFGLNPAVSVLGNEDVTRGNNFGQSNSATISR